MTTVSSLPGMALSLALLVAHPAAAEPLGGGAGALGIGEHRGQREPGQGRGGQAGQDPAALGSGRVIRVEEAQYAGANGALKMAHDTPEEFWKRLS